MREKVCRFYINKEKKDRNGYVTIMVRMYYKKQQLVKSTNNGLSYSERFKIEIKNWCDKNQKVIGGSKSLQKYINTKLDEIENNSKVLKEKMHEHNFSKAQAVVIWKNPNTPIEEITNEWTIKSSFLKYYEIKYMPIAMNRTKNTTHSNYNRLLLMMGRLLDKKEVNASIKNKTNNISKKTLQIAKNINKDYPIHLINTRDFINYIIEVMQFLTNKYSNTGKYKISYINRIITDLNSSIKEAQKIMPLNYDSTIFIKTNTEKSKIALNNKDIQAIKTFKTNNKELDKTKDWLIISLYSGQRFSDWNKFTIKNALEPGKKLLYIEETEKCGSPATIPVNKTIQGVLNKYGGKLPPVPSSNAQYNKLVKIVAKKAGLTNVVEIKHKWTCPITNKKKSETENMPLYRAISSKIGRVSLITKLLYQTDLNHSQIMTVTNHKKASSLIPYTAPMDVNGEIRISQALKKIE